MTSKMPKTMALHWKTFLILTGSMLASFLFALGHHLYYQSLAGTSVSTASALGVDTWAGVPAQKFNTAVGTTFASLFRTSLAITVTTAYTQMAWKAFKAHKTEVAVVDAISDILQNPFSFFKVGAWRKSVWLLSLALAIWLLPIAPIITPATLTVETASRALSHMVNVSSVDFNSLNFASMLSNAQGGCGFLYQGPHFEVSKVVGSAAVQGDILAFAAPRNQPNASYTTRFTGPSLQCADVTEPLRSQIISNVNISSYNTSASFGYLSWTSNKNSELPFDEIPASLYGQPYDLRLDSIGPVTDIYNTTALNIYVAAFPQMMNVYQDGGLEPYYGDSTIVGCGLKETTYDASFRWENGIRSINVTAAPSDVNVSYSFSVDCSRFLWADDYDVPQSAAESDQRHQGPLSAYNNSIVQNLAYQAVMDAFGKILVGSISNTRVRNSLNVAATTALNTPLGEVREFAFMRNYTTNVEKTLLSHVEAPDSIYWPGISVNSTMESKTDLRSTLELLFQNVTMSLMSSPLLQPDPATPYHPAQENVTFTTYDTLYVYSAVTLWLAYGIAMLLALITVAAGCLAIFSSGISYSTSFSTILRTTSHAHVSAQITKEDAVGQDPLPKHLAKATIDFRDRELEETVEMIPSKDRSRDASELRSQTF